MATPRIYEVVLIISPNAGEDETTKLIESLQQTVADQGGTVTKTENMGRRTMAYEIDNQREGVYVLFEIEGSGGEIAELERRMRVNDQIVRYLTVRVDEDRRRADKLRERRARKASKRPLGASAADRSIGGAGTAAAPALAPSTETEDEV